MGILKNYFDGIYCITSKTDSKRKKNFIKQVKELGLYDDITFYYFEDTNTYSIPRNKITKLLKHPLLKRSLSCAISHYNCVKDAQKNGYNNVLIFEDDVYFPKDINTIVKILDNMPKDYGLIRFSWPFSLCENFEYSLIERNECCAAAYALSKDAIDDYVNHQQNVQLEVADHFFLILDKEKYKCYYSNTWLAFPFDDTHELERYIADLARTYPTDKVKEIQRNMYYETSERLRSSIWSRNF